MTPLEEFETMTLKGSARLKEGEESANSAIGVATGSKVALSRTGGENGPEGSNWRRSCDSSGRAKKIELVPPDVSSRKDRVELEWGTWERTEGSV